MSCNSLFSRASLVATAFVFAVPMAIGQVAAPPAPAAVAKSSAVQPMELQSLIKERIAKADLDATVCVYMRDVDTNTVVADFDGTTPLAPASNNKLVTTAAGLTLLGPDYQFVTRILATGPVKDGTLQGDLIIYGTGDPTISGRYQADKMDVEAIPREWAQKLKDAGIKKIAGNIVADDSYFDDNYFNAEWYKPERAEYYSAEISALSFNDNCVDIQWNAKGKLPGDAAAYELNPKTDYVNFTSEVKVAAKGRPTERYYARGADDNNIRVTGDINVDVVKLDSAAVHDGALFFVTMFEDVLKKQGISVDGKPVKTRGAADSTSGVIAMFEHKSPKLIQVCQTINLNSQNYFTECLGKALGKIKGGEGSFAAGAKVIMDFCKTEGIYHEGHSVVDACGLASVDRVTGRQLVEVLKYMDTHGLKEQFRSTLPQGDTRGSLKVRFNDTPENKAIAPRIFGKTGLIGGVRSLSGIVTDKNGREYYYSIILNHLKDNEAAAGMKLIDELALTMAKSGK